MQSKYSLGILFKLLNLLIFTIISLGLLTKSKALNPLEEFFFICLSGTIFLLPWVICTKAKYLKTKRYTKYLLRALLSIAAMLTWIESLKSLGGNEATLIAYLNPLFVLILASLCNEERINKIVLLAVLICIAVVVFALKLETNNFNLAGVILGLCSSASWALYEIVCKKQTSSEHYLAQAFYTLLFGALIMLPFIVVYSKVELKLTDVGVMSVLGILRVCNIICLFLAYKFAPVNLLAPFTYSRMAFMVIGSFLLFQAIPSLSVSIVTIVIIAINIYIFRIQNLGKLYIEKFR